MSGALRATGMQFKAAVVNFVSYYVIGLPLGITLALVVGLGAKGMWIGLCLGDGLQVCHRACVHKVHRSCFLIPARAIRKAYILGIKC